MNDVIFEAWTDVYLVCFFVIPFISLVIYVVSFIFIALIFEQDWYDPFERRSGVVCFVLFFSLANAIFFGIFYQANQGEISFDAYKVVEELATDNSDLQILAQQYLFDNKITRWEYFLYRMRQEKLSYKSQQRINDDEAHKIKRRILNLQPSYID